MSKNQFPPFPALSALRQTSQFFKDPFRLISQCHRDLGDIFALKLLGMGNWVFVSNPEHIKVVFKAPPDVLVSGQINAKMLGHMLGTDATFSLDGDEHLRRRKLMLPFFNGKGALDNVERIRDVANAELDKWPVGQALPFLPWSMHTSLEVVMHILFGASPAEDLKALTSAFERYAEDGLRSPLLLMPFLQWNLGPLSPWGKILGLRRKAFTAFDKEISKRRSSPETFASRDVASQLCAWQGEDGYLSNESIRDEVFNDLFAGHETTAKVLAWALECALTYPHTMTRLQEELDSALGDEAFEAKHLKLLPYTEAFLEEVRRLRPLGPFAGVRLTKEAFQLGGFQIPPGTTIVQCLPLLAARPELFGNPEAFEPERFLDTKIKAYTWNPFGGGRRMCLGKGLAEVELVVLLAVLLQRFHIKLAQDKVERVRAGFFFAPSQDLMIEVIPRH